MGKIYNKTQLFSFIALFAVVTIVVGLLFLPFFKILAIAGIFAVLIYPVHLRVKLKIKNENLASLATTLLFLVAVVFPLWLVGQQMFNELVELYNRFRYGNLVFNSQDILKNMPESVRNIAQVFSNDLSAMISNITKDTFNLISQLLSNLAGFFLSIFLFTFIIFFFFRDAEKIKDLLVKIFPLSKQYESVLFVKLENAISSVVKGSFLVAIIQGVAATLGYYACGIPQPLLWGAATALSSLVPTVGTSLVMIPAVLYLWLSGHGTAAIGLALWGMLLVGTIDNMLGPKLIGQKSKLHPMLVLLSILGGVQLFGFLGFLFGPIIMAAFTALLEIYLNDIMGLWQGSNNES